MKFFGKSLFALVLGACVGAPVQAATFNGDMVDAFVNHGIETDFTALGGCQFYENLGVVIGAGVEVGAANDVGGGCNGGIAADIDGTGLLTLTPSDAGSGDYRWAEIIFNGFDQVITGVSLVTNDLFTLSGVGDVIPTPDISFTASSVRILFDPVGLSVFDVTPATGGVTSFQIQTGPAVVPLPASLPLMLAGLAGLVAVRRRKN